MTINKLACFLITAYLLSGGMVHFISGQTNTEIEGNLIVEDTITISSLSGNNSSKDLVVDPDGRLLVKESETKVLSLGPAAFQPTRDYGNVLNFGTFFQADSIDTPHFMIAPVTLKDGATLDSLSFIFVDTSNTYMTCSLNYSEQDNDISFGTGSQITTENEPKSNDYKELTRSFLHIVNNSERFYYITICAQDYWDGIKLKVKGVRLWYRE